MIRNPQGALRYEESSPTGLVWLVNASTRARAGQPAGSDFEGRYWRIRYKGVDDLVHRLVYRLTHGPIPEGMQIDHIDGNGKNNVCSNLRAVPCEINQRNRRKCVRNATGITGVSLVRGGEGYEAKVCIPGIRRARTKYFSIRKHGLAALDHAVNWRNSAIAELNKSGAGYSDIHGQDRAAV